MQRFHDSLIHTQREQAPGTVLNSAGGYSFALDRWRRLERFLVLGTHGGTYYASERELTRQNATIVSECLSEHHGRTVDAIVEISRSGRAPKNDPALFALAMALVSGSSDARKAIPIVARTGTHLFHLIEYYKGLGGKWGRATRSAFGAWYLDKRPDALALQAIKYQQRDGWSHRDVLRLTHPRATGTANSVLHWMARGWESVGDEPHFDEALRLIWAFEKAKRADRKELIRLIEEHGLPHECVPNEAKSDPAVWGAMLPSMGMTAMLRNLGKMTSVGLIKPLSQASRIISDRLMRVEALKSARVHPLAILAALRVYASGHGVKGSLSWTPDQSILGALNEAFTLSFHAVQPSGKRFMLALDVSGSMDGGTVAGSPGITPRDGSVAMALVTHATEPQTHVMAFSHQPIAVNIAPGTTLQSAIHVLRQVPFGATDCSIPMLVAANEGIDVDVFVVYTDSETWAGKMHPHVALERYRQKTGIGAKMIVVGMTSNGFSIANPDDAGMLDVVGFDSATPALMADFARA